MYRLIISGSMYLAWVWVVARVNFPESLSKNSFFRDFIFRTFPRISSANPRSLFPTSVNLVFAFPFL